MTKRKSKPVNKTYAAWSYMKSRCYNKNSSMYSYNGGRGIKVCDRWRFSFSNFLFDMGEKPEGMFMHRLDINKDYEPNNCEWSTLRITSGHTRKIKVTLKDAKEIKLLISRGIKVSTIAKRYSLSKGTIYLIKSGKSWTDA